MDSRPWLKLATLAVVPLLGVLITALHFNALLRSPMGETMWGISHSADPVGDLSFVDDLLRQEANGCPGHRTSHSFPFGELQPPAPHRYLTPAFPLLIGLAKLTGQLVLSYNLTILILFLLNYALIYAAARGLCRDRVAALIPAVLITFSAYCYAHSWAHLGLMPVFFFPWFLLAFTRLQEAATRGWAVLAGLIIGLSVYTSPYYFYFLVWMAAAILLAHAVTRPRQLFTLRHLGGNALAVAVAAAAVLPFVRENYLVDFAPFWHPPNAEANYGTDVSVLFNFTARPLDYILPNIHNIVFGAAAARYIPDQSPWRGPYSDELPVSLGVLPTVAILVLAAVLLRPKWRRWLTAPAGGSRPALVLSLVLIMIIAFVLSLPHYLGGVPLPNELLRRVLPFRSYARFGIVVLTALSSLIACLVARLPRGRALAAAVLILACVLESWPETHLHAASAAAPYIKFLRERPERVLMRFESQNHALERRVDQEIFLTGKSALNGDINLFYDYTDLPLATGFRGFNVGQLGQLGAELLVVSGHLDPAPATPFLELLAAFPEDQVEIWKIKPGNQPPVTSLFQPLVERARTDPCFVAPKPLVEQILKTYFGMIKG